MNSHWRLPPNNLMKLNCQKWITIIQKCKLLLNLFEHKTCNLHTFEFWIHSTISKRINSLVDLCFYGGKIFWFFFSCRVLLLYTSVFFGTNFHLSNVASRPNYLVLLDRKRWMCLMSRSGPWHQGMTPMHLSKGKTYIHYNHYVLLMKIYLQWCKRLGPRIVV